MKQGETVRFVVSNSGRMLHEFNIGTEAMHASHALEMQEMRRKGMITNRRLRHDRMRAAGMMHDDPNSVLLEPGESAELIWTFDGEAKLSVSCNLPGHAASGMTADVSIVDDVS